ncbi:XRE family transcriptional regulator [Streptomyces buecherae]|uniref:XRE family transcriptional regulator n=1 Tax=Streptomyces buecherae TaxID=2763006 RepID=UPI0036C5093E
MERNAALAAAMDAMGIKQADLADRLDDEIRRMTGRDAQLTNRQVRRWLNGEVGWPQEVQRMALEAVLKRPAVELGFKPRAKSAGREDPMERRTLLNAATGAVAAIGLHGPRFGYSDVERFRDEYLRIVKADWAIGGSRDVENKAVELAAQIQSTLSEGSGSARARQQLYSLASDVMSCAAFAAIDARVNERARTHLNHAVALAGLSRSSESQYHVWNHYAMLAGQQRNATEAAAATAAMKGFRVAQRNAKYGSLAHMRNAVALTYGNFRTEALRSLSAAEKAYGRVSNTDQHAAWIDFYDESEVSGLSASVWFKLGDFARAEECFSRALDTLRPSLVRNRALYTAHLSLSQARKGEVEQACATADRALHTLNPGSGSQRTMKTLRDVRRVLISVGSSAPEVTAWLERVENGAQTLR